MELITDRTAYDVYAGNAKGRYSAADLDRVERTVEDICRQLQAVGIALELPVCTTWQRDRRIPGREEMERYLNNVRQIIETLGISTGLPYSMENLDFEGANLIEMALDKAYRQIAKLKIGE